MNSRRVYTLKHATPRMKIHHMNMVMDFKAELKESQARTMTPGTREYLVEEIKRMMGGGTIEFHNWFDAVYFFRRNNDMPTYEKKIKQKYYYLKRREKKRSTPPSTSGMTAMQASETLSDWIFKNWQYIPEIPL